jgi:hypothetical protein
MEHYGRLGYTKITWHLGVYRRSIWSEDKILKHHLYPFKIQEFKEHLYCLLKLSH